MSFLAQPRLSAARAQLRVRLVFLLKRNGAARRGCG